MRISDWSSDVCSSDLFPTARRGNTMSESAPRERDASVREDVGAAIEREGREIAGKARSAVHRLARDQRDAVAGFVSAVVGAATRGAEEIEESGRSEEHTSELQSLMRNSYAVFCLKKKQE